MSLGIDLGFFFRLEFCLHLLEQHFLIKTIVIHIFQFWLDFLFNDFHQRGIFLMDRSLHVVHVAPLLRLLLGAQ
jgi:hypothetical protein